jgi:hypothetical protein
LFDGISLFLNQDKGMLLTNKSCKRNPVLGYSPDLGSSPSSTIAAIAHLQHLLKTPDRPLGKVNKINERLLAAPATTRG